MIFDDYSKTRMIIAPRESSRGSVEFFGEGERHEESPAFALRSVHGARSRDRASPGARLRSSRTLPQRQQLRPRPWRWRKRFGDSRWRHHHRRHSQRSHERKATGTRLRLRGAARKAMQERLRRSNLRRASGVPQNLLGPVFSPMVSRPIVRIRGKSGSARNPPIRNRPDRKPIGIFLCARNSFKFLRIS